MTSRYHQAIGHCASCNVPVSCTWTLDPSLWSFRFEGPCEQKSGESQGIWGKARLHYIHKIISYHYDYHILHISSLTSLHYDSPQSLTLSLSESESHALPHCTLSHCSDLQIAIATLFCSIHSYSLMMLLNWNLESVNLNSDAAWLTPWPMRMPRANANAQFRWEQVPPISFLIARETTSNIVDRWLAANFPMPANYQQLPTLYLLYWHCQLHSLSSRWSFRLVRSAWQSFPQRCVKQWRHWFVRLPRRTRRLRREKLRIEFE